MQDDRASSGTSQPLLTLGLNTQEQAQVEVAAERLSCGVRQFDREAALIEVLSEDATLVVLSASVSGDDRVMQALAKPGRVEVVILANAESDGVNLGRLAYQYGVRVVALICAPFSVATMQALLLSVGDLKREKRMLDSAQKISSRPALPANVIPTSEEIATAFQPKIDSYSGTLLGFEALARWHHPSLGLTGPNFFVPDAETSGTIRKLTLDIARHAISSFGKLQRVGFAKSTGFTALRSVTLSLNMSTSLLRDNELFRELVFISNQNEVPVNRLCLQFNAWDLCCSGVDYRNELESIRGLGFGIGLDQYDPESHDALYQTTILDLVSEVTFDKRAIMMMTTSRSAQDVLSKSIADLTRSSKVLTAMGISDQETLTLMSDLGAAQAQGYYIAAPMPPETVLEWFQRREKAREFKRLDALHALNLLDTPQEARFDRWTDLARRLFDVPSVRISLVDSDRQWFKSRNGTEDQQTDRNRAICSIAIESDHQMILKDASSDPYLQSHPAVAGGNGIRFYAAQPLIIRPGYKVGTLCLVAMTPRGFSSTDRRLLGSFGRIVVAEVECAGSRQLADIQAVQPVTQSSAVAVAFRELWREVDKATIIVCANVENFDSVPSTLTELATCSDFVGSYQGNTLVFVFVAGQVEDVTALINRSGGTQRSAHWLSVNPGDSRSFVELIDHCRGKVDSLV